MEYEKRDDMGKKPAFYYAVLHKVWPAFLGIWASCCFPFLSIFFIHIRLQKNIRIIGPCEGVKNGAVAATPFFLSEQGR